VIPYVRHPEEKITAALGMLKVKEGVQLLMHAMPGLKEFLFDFPNPIRSIWKNSCSAIFIFNVPVEIAPHGEPCGFL